MPPQRPLLASPIFTLPARGSLITRSGCEGQSFAKASVSRLATKFGTAFPATSLLLGVPPRAPPGPTCREMLRRYESTQEISKLVWRWWPRRQGLGYLGRLRRPWPPCGEEATGRPCEGAAQACGGAVHRRPRRVVAVPQPRGPARPPGGPARGVRRPNRSRRPDHGPA